MLFSEIDGVGIWISDVEIYEYYHSRKNNLLNC